MSLPVMNSHVVSTMISLVEEDHNFLPTVVQIPIFSTPGVVDVSGMEFAVAMVVEAATTDTQDVASTDGLLKFQFADTGTTAESTATVNPLLNATDLTSSRDGGWAAHEAAMAVGTSTTDLDADDWVTLHTVANATTTGAGAVTVRAHFVYGKPGAIA
jgi:hypothetical protein